MEDFHYGRQQLEQMMSKLQLLRQDLHHYQQSYRVAAIFAVIGWAAFVVSLSLHPA